MKIRKFGGTESRIYELVQPIAEEFGLIVWDVRFEKEGAMWYLRVFLDHMERPVNITDCENVTRPLNKLLDELDPIPQSYTLEVGSAANLAHQYHGKYLVIINKEHLPYPLDPVNDLEINAPIGRVFSQIDLNEI